MKLYLIAAVLTSATGALAFILVNKSSRSGIFFYLCLCSILLFISASAAAISSFSPVLIAYTSPLIDISIVFFGISLAVASGWLAYSFKLAGEHVD